MENTKKLYSYQDVADMFRVSTNTIRRKVREGKFPSPIRKNANNVKFRDSDILKELNNFHINNSSN